MTKIILIEDRSNRQQFFLTEKFSEFEKFVNQGDIKNISGGEAFDEINLEFNRSNFDELLNYDVIMLHRSAFSSDLRNKLIEYLKVNKKTLVLFSGGISSVELSLNNSFSFLLLNVNDFYNNLLIYLKDDEKDIYKLAYGDKWEINLLYAGIEKLSRYLQGDLKIPFRAFETEIPNIYIKNNYFKNYYNDTNLTKKDLEDVLNKIFNDLNELI